jgi:Transposase zinc-ribbon domain
LRGTPAQANTPPGAGAEAARKAGPEKTERCVIRFRQVVALRAPVPRPDFPGTIMEFQERFATDAACVEYLAASRWPEGFICPACGGRTGRPGARAAASPAAGRSPSRPAPARRRLRSPRLVRGCCRSLVTSWCARQSTIPERRAAPPRGPESLVVRRLEVGEPSRCAADLAPVQPGSFGCGVRLRGFREADIETRRLGAGRRLWWAAPPTRRG